MNLEPMARDLGALLKARGETVAVSESSTGASSAPPSSLGPRRVGVLRRRRRGVHRRRPPRPDRAAGHASAATRSSSEPYAELGARTIRERLGTTWGLAETGAAGPSGNRYGDAAGHTCLAVSGPVDRVLTLETGRDGREANMWEFANAALGLLHEAVRAA